MKCPVCGRELSIHYITSECEVVEDKVSIYGTTSCSNCDKFLIWHLTLDEFGNLHVEKAQEFKFC